MIVGDTDPIFIDGYTSLGYADSMPLKLVTVAEVDPFDAAARRAGLSEEERAELIEFLAANP